METYTFNNFWGYMRLIPGSRQVDSPGEEHEKRAWLHAAERPLLFYYTKLSMVSAGGVCVSSFVCNKYFFDFACDWQLAGRQNGAGAGDPGEVGELAGFAGGVEAVV